MIHRLRPRRLLPGERLRDDIIAARQEDLTAHGLLAVLVIWIGVEGSLDGLGVVVLAVAHGAPPLGVDLSSLTSGEGDLDGDEATGVGDLLALCDPFYASSMHYPCTIMNPWVNV